VECYRPHDSVGMTTPVQSTASQKYAHENAVKIVNKRPRNLLNEIQNVFINRKQVKTVKVTQIIPWFQRFYGTKTTGNSQRRYRPHAWTVTFARWQRLYQRRFLAAANSLTAWKWVVVI